MEKGSRKMRLIRNMEARVGIAGELIEFLWVQKMWWMIPVVSILLLFGLLIGFGTASGLGPFVYTLF
jgi:hypothetical protein